MRTVVWPLYGRRRRHNWLNMWPNIACSLFVFFVIVFFWTGMAILPIYWPWNVKFILQKIRHAKTSLECSFSNSDVFWLQCISYGLIMIPIHWFDVSWYMLWSSSYYLHHQQVQNYWTQITWFIIKHPHSQPFCWFIPLFWSHCWLSLWSWSH